MYISTVNLHKTLFRHQPNCVCAVVSGYSSWTACWWPVDSSTGPVSSASAAIDSSGNDNESSSDILVQEQNPISAHSYFRFFLINRNIGNLAIASILSNTYILRTLTSGCLRSLEIKHKLYLLFMYSTYHNNILEHCTRIWTPAVWCAP